MKVCDEESENVQELSSVVIDVMKNLLFEFYSERNMNRNKCSMNFYREYDSDFVSACVIREFLFNTYLYNSLLEINK